MKWCCRRRVAVWSPLRCSALTRDMAPPTSVALTYDMHQNSTCTVCIWTSGTTHQRIQKKTWTSIYVTCARHTHTHTNTQQDWCIYKQRGFFIHSVSLFASNQPSSVAPLREMCFAICGCHGEEMRNQVYIILSISGASASKTCWLRPVFL